jgi:5'-methylthioinosine phosphorylase
MSGLAVIGGTGLAQLPQFEVEREVILDTPWGKASHPALEGRLEGQPLWFLPRHGRPHTLPPHAINYRANLWLLRELGVSQILAINAVGGLREAFQPGDLLVPDQIIDYTWGREHTYFDGSSEHLEHVDFSDPYCPLLRQALLGAIGSAGFDCEDGGVYAATQGPRLETAAEVRRLARDGGDVVGMTGMPEAGLARELALSYASLCIVVNPGAGLTEELITLAAMGEVLAQAAQQVSATLVQFLAAESG